MPFGTKSSSLIIKGGLKIKGCKIEVLLYHLNYNLPKIAPHWTDVLLKFKISAVLLLAVNMVNACTCH